MLKKRIRYGILLLALICLTGCGSTEETLSTEETTLKETTLNVTDCIEVFLPEMVGADYEYSFSATDASGYYVLQNYATKEDGKLVNVFYFTSLDVNAGEPVIMQWNLQNTSEPGEKEKTDVLLEALQNNEARVTGMDVAEGRIYLFIQQNDAEKQEVIHYYRACMDQEGNVKAVLDLVPALREGEALPRENMLLPGGVCDYEGRSYVSDAAMTGISVIDETGKLLTVLKEEDSPQASLSYIGKSPEGMPLYACGNAIDKNLTILGFDGVESKELYRGDYELLQGCCLNTAGNLIYGNGSKLLRWDMNQGTREILYDGVNLSFLNCDGILEGADGELYAVMRQTDGTYIYEFSDREIPTVEIWLEQFCWEDGYIRTCAAEYSRRHPGVIIRVTEPEEDTGLQLNHAMAQLSQGEGPDLFLVRREQLQILQEKGVLAELSEVLPAEEQEQIFPGVLESGRIDNGLYGITTSATLSTLLVSDRIWEEDSWSYADISELLQNSPIEQFSSYSANASDMLYDLILANIGNSSLLDPESGKCYFNSEEFCRLLALCKEYSQGPENAKNFTGEEAIKLVQEGKALVYKLEGGFADYSRSAARLGEGYHAVGFPAAGKDGSLLMNYYGCVAVSAAAEQREIIDDFLCYLMDYRTQRQYNTDWVREDVLRDCVLEQVEINNYPNPVPVFYMGDRSVTILEGKPDGTSYLPEYLEVMRNSAPYESELEDIRNIIREEAAAYFSGDKEVWEAAEIIQSRVQPYLDER